MNSATLTLRWLYPLSALVAFSVLIYLARDMTFRVDDWDLIARRSLSDPAGLMRPFNEQWVLVPAIVFRLIFGIVGMSSYLPYLVVLLLLHVLVAEGVRRLVATAAGDLVGYAAGIVVLFLGTGAENLRWAFQIGMVLATGAGLWAIYLLVKRRSTVAPALLLTVAIASHAIGVAFLAAAFALMILDRPRDVIWLAIPGVILAAWMIVWGLPALTGRGGTLTAGLPWVPFYIVAGAATAIGALFALHTSAGIVLAGIGAAVLALTRARPAQPKLLIAAVVAVCAEYGLVAISRSEYGISAVAWSRYTYVAVPLVLISICAWVGRRFPEESSRAGRAGLVLVSVAALSAALNIRAYADSRQDELAYVHRARAVVGVAVWSDDARRPGSDVHIPDPARLRELVAAHGSPTTDALLPAVVPPIPSAIAREICLEMLTDASDLSRCEAALAEIGAD